MRAYSRMDEAPDYKDKNVAGCNPCVEQSLEDNEVCCLVECFINRHDDLKDFLRTLKFAYLYAKTVTLGKTHVRATNRIVMRNRRIGTSLTGIAQFLADKSLGELKKWLQEGYATITKWDNVYSDWMCVPRSIKKTSIKPSGTISLLPGVTPGCHDPESQYMIRRVRLPAASELVPKLRDAGYPIEPDVSDPAALVVEFPITVGGNIRSVKEVSMWEQLARAAFLQRYWADNQVSCTVSFDPETEGPHIEAALNYYQYQLKGISFLPRLDGGAYPQMPFEACSKEEYERRLASLTIPNYQGLVEEPVQEKGCSNDTCELPRS